MTFDLRFKWPEASTQDDIGFPAHLALDQLGGYVGMDVPVWVRLTQGYRSLLFPKSPFTVPVRNE